MSRRVLGGLAALILSSGLIAAVALPAQATAAATPNGPTLTNIRTGAHPTFDRIVLDITPAPRPSLGYRFADELIREPSGEIEWLTGCAFAEVLLYPAYAHDAEGDPSYPGPRKFRTRNLGNVMAVAVTRDADGYLALGIGMRKQTWIKLFTLTGPDRIVIDVGR